MKFIVAAGIWLSLALHPTLAISKTTDPPAFVVGERLTYQIFWGPLAAGKAIMEVVGIESVDGHDCYRIKAFARTTGLVDLLFHIESTSESWLDVNDLCSRRYRQDRTEGKHVSKDETTFDYRGGKFSITNHVNSTIQTFPLTQPAVDVISSVYLMRAQPLALNSSHEFMVNARRTNYVVTLSPNERRTIWVRPLGEVAALRIEPKPTLRIVAANKGRMWLWVSDDTRRLPLLLTTKMSIGTATLVLDKIESPPPPAQASQPAAKPHPPRPFDFSSKRQ